MVRLVTSVVYAANMEESCDVFMIPAGMHDAVVCQGRQEFEFEVTGGLERFSSGFFRQQLLPTPRWFDLKLLASPRSSLSRRLRRKGVGGVKRSDKFSFIADQRYVAKRWKWGGFRSGG